MNEKRFTWKTEKLQHSDDEVLLVVDNENKEWKGHILNIVDLLNEQQATNDYLEESNSRLQIQLGETLRLVDEQQATIRKLQDLCGESDGENAKLLIENKKLKEEKGYWKSKAMTLLMQVRRLTPRMTDKEVIEFSKELEDE